MRRACIWTIQTDRYRTRTVRLIAIVLVWTIITIVQIVSIAVTALVAIVAILTIAVITVVAAVALAKWQSANVATNALIDKFIEAIKPLPLHTVRVFLLFFA